MTLQHCWRVRPSAVRDRPCRSPLRSLPRSTDFRVPITAGVIIAGGAAGVAAAFNTPLAGVSFAIEELANSFEQRVDMLVMTAILISGMVSLGIAGDYVYFGALPATLPVGRVLIIAPSRASSVESRAAHLRGSILTVTRHRRRLLRSIR